MTVRPPPSSFSSPCCPLLMADDGIKMIAFPIQTFPKRPANCSVTAGRSDTLSDNSTNNTNNTSNSSSSRSSSNNETNTRSNKTGNNMNSSSYNQTSSAATDSSNIPKSVNTNENFVDRTINFDANRANTNTKILIDNSSYRNGSTTTSAVEVPCSVVSVGKRRRIVEESEEAEVEYSITKRKTSKHYDDSIPLVVSQEQFRSTKQDLGDDISFVRNPMPEIASSNLELGVYASQSSTSSLPVADPLLNNKSSPQSRALTIGAMEVLLSHYMMPETLLSIAGLPAFKVFNVDFNITEERDKLHNELRTLDATMANTFLEKSVSQKYDELTFYPALYKPSSSHGSNNNDTCLQEDIFNLRMFEELMLEVAELLEMTNGNRVQEQLLQVNSEKRFEQPSYLPFHLELIDKLQDSFELVQLLQLCLKLFSRKFRELADKIYLYANKGPNTMDVRKFLCEDCCQVFNGFVHNLFLMIGIDHEPSTTGGYIPINLTFEEWYHDLCNIFNMFTSYQNIVNVVIHSSVSGTYREKLNGCLHSELYHQLLLKCDCYNETNNEFRKAYVTQLLKVLSLLRVNDWKHNASIKVCNVIKQSFFTLFTFLPLLNSIHTRDRVLAFGYQWLALLRIEEAFAETNPTSVVNDDDLLRVRCQLNIVMEILESTTEGGGAKCVVDEALFSLSRHRFCDFIVQKWLTNSTTLSRCYKLESNLVTFGIFVSSLSGVDPFDNQLIQSITEMSDCLDDVIFSTPNGVNSVLETNWGSMASCRSQLIQQALEIKEQSTTVEEYSQNIEYFLVCSIFNETCRLIPMLAYDILVTLPFILPTITAVRSLRLIESLDDMLRCIKLGKWSALMDHRSLGSKCDVLIRLLSEIMASSASDPVGKFDSNCLQFMYMLLILMKNVMLLHKSVEEWNECTPKHLREPSLPSLLDYIVIITRIAKEVIYLVFLHKNPMRLRNRSNEIVSVELIQSLSYSFQAAIHLERVFAKIRAINQTANMKTLMSIYEHERSVSQYLLDVAMGNYQPVQLLSMNCKLYSVLMVDLLCPSQFRQDVEGAIYELMNKDYPLVFLETDAVYHWYYKALECFETTHYIDAGRSAMMVAELLKHFSQLILSGIFTSDCNYKSLSGLIHQANQKMSFARKSYEYFIESSQSSMECVSLRRKKYVVFEDEQTTTTNNNGPNETNGQLLPWIFGHTYQRIALAWWDTMRGVVTDTFANVAENKYLSVVCLLNAESTQTELNSTRHETISTSWSSCNLAAVKILYAAALLNYNVNQQSSELLFDSKSYNELATSIVQRIESHVQQVICIEQGIRCSGSGQVISLDWERIALNSSNLHLLAFWIAMKYFLQGMFLRKMQLHIREGKEYVDNWIRDHDLATDCLLADCDLLQPMQILRARVTVASNMPAGLIGDPSRLIILRQLLIFRSNCYILKVEMSMALLLVSCQIPAGSSSSEAILRFVYHHVNAAMDNILESVIDHRSLGMFSSLSINIINRSFLLSKIKVRYVVGLINAVLIAHGISPLAIGKSHLEGHNIFNGMNDNVIFKLEESLDQIVYNFISAFYIEPSDNDNRIGDDGAVWTALKEISSSKAVESLQQACTLCLESALTCLKDDGQKFDHTAILANALIDVDVLIFGS